MQIRDVRDDEIDELIDHMDLVFNIPPERMEMAYRHDSTVRLHQVKVAVEDGRIVSAVRVANRPVRIGEVRVEMGGIGGVSTHPDYRGRGYCTAVLEAQIEYMQQQEYDISMLFTGIVGFYRRLGWYSFPEHSAKAPVPDTFEADCESPYIVREYQQDTDLDAVIACYDDYNAERTLSMVRHRQYWLDGHTQFMGGVPWLVAERDGQVSAYLSGSTDDVHEACCLDGHLAAFDALADSVMERAADGDTDEIRCRLHYNHPMTDRFRQICGGRISHTFSEGMMLRVIQLAPLLQKLVPVFQRRLCEACFNCPEPMSIGFDLVGQSATLAVEGQSVAVTDDAADLQLHINSRQFFMLLLGGGTVDEQWRLLQARGNNIADSYRGLIRVLFPRQEYTYYGCDHF